MRRFRVLIWSLIFLLLLVKVGEWVHTSYTDYRVNALVGTEQPETEPAAEEFVEEQEEPTEPVEEPVKESVEEQTEPEEEPTVEEPVLLEKYREMYETNPDMIGYIKLTDKYEYPIVQRKEDQNYYEHRNFFGESATEGSIFANRYTSLGEPGVSLLYGHTMKNGSMFGSLKKYKTWDYFKEHRYIELDTLYEEATYEVIAVAETSLHESFAYYDYVGNLSEEVFNDWKSGFEPYMVSGTLDEVDFGDTVVELSCCAYHVKDGRLVVILRKVME